MGFLVTVPHRETCPLFSSLTGSGASTLFLPWLFLVHSLFQVAFAYKFCLCSLPKRGEAQDTNTITVVIFRIILSLSGVEALKFTVSISASNRNP